METESTLNVDEIGIGRGPERRRALERTVNVARRWLETLRVVLFVIVKSAFGTESELLQK